VSSLWTEAQWMISMLSFTKFKLLLVQFLENGFHLGLVQKLGNHPPSTNLHEFHTEKIEPVLSTYRCFLVISWATGITTSYMAFVLCWVLQDIWR
jgi:hypothetical protein